MEGEGINCWGDFFLNQGVEDKNKKVENGENGIKKETPLFRT